MIVFLRDRNELGWVGSRIITVEQGYFRAETASAAIIQLVPGWKIDTDAGTFFVDGISQKVLPIII